MRSGTLYVVATPIGNLEDLTHRAARVLREVDLIACEDTRHTRLLLGHYGITTPLISYHEHNEAERAPELLRRLQAGKSIALVSDAGTPVLSDPGYALVRQAIAAAVPIVPVPGPSAITAALSVAGLPTDRFVFLGFLPRRASERRRALQDIAAVPWTLVLFEAPHRIAATLRDVRECLGDREVVVIRELTKKFEDVLRGTAADVLERLERTPPRGEFTVIVAGAATASKSAAGDPAADLRALLSSGTPAREAVRQVARAHGLPRRSVYELALRVQGKKYG